MGAETKGVMMKFVCLFRWSPVKVQTLYFGFYVEVFATIQAFAITLDRTPYLSKCCQRALSCMAVVDC